MNFTQTLITRIRDEINALKVATPLNVGQLRFPSSAPSVNYSGSINTSSSDLVIARLAATFTRTDGSSDPPYVDFAFSAYVSPNQQQAMASMGITFTGPDVNAYEDFYINGYVNNVGTGSVTFYVEVKNAVNPYGSSPKTLNAQIQAISTVEGNLTLTRLI